MRSIFIWSSGSNSIKPDKVLGFTLLIGYFALFLNGNPESTYRKSEDRIIKIQASLFKQTDTESGSVISSEDLQCFASPSLRAAGPEPELPP